MLVANLEAVSQVLLAHPYPEVLPARPISLREVRAARNRLLCRHYTEGESRSDLAREFHISPQRVHQVVHEERWWEVQARSGLPKVV